MYNRKRLLLPPRVQALPVAHLLYPSQGLIDLRRTSTSTEASCAAQCMWLAVTSPDYSNQTKFKKREGPHWARHLHGTAPIAACPKYISKKKRWGTAQTSEKRLVLWELLSTNQEDTGPFPSLGYGFSEFEQVLKLDLP